MLDPERSGLSLLEAASVDAEPASLMRRETAPCWLRLLCELLKNKVQSFKGNKWMLGGHLGWRSHRAALGDWN